MAEHHPQEDCGKDLTAEIHSLQTNVIYLLAPSPTFGVLLVDIEDPWHIEFDSM